MTQFGKLVALKSYGYQPQVALPAEPSHCSAIALVSSRPVVPNLFGTRDWFRGRQLFQGQGWGNGFRMIQVYYIYCVLYYYYIVHCDYKIMWAMGSSCKHRWTSPCLPATHLLQCGLVPVHGIGFGTPAKCFGSLSKTFCTKPIGLVLSLPSSSSMI